jgi:hypothetical protein
LLAGAALTETGLEAAIGLLAGAGAAAAVDLLARVALFGTGFETVAVCLLAGLASVRAAIAGALGLLAGVTLCETDFDAVVGLRAGPEAVRSGAGEGVDGSTASAILAVLRVSLTALGCGNGDTRSLSLSSSSLPCSARGLFVAGRAPDAFAADDWIGA